MRDVMSGSVLTLLCMQNLPKQYWLHKFHKFQQLHEYTEPEVDACSLYQGQ